MQTQKGGIKAIMKNMEAVLRGRQLWIITLILFIVSIIIDACALWWADYNEPIVKSLWVVPYKTFFEVPAWFPFPIYFAIAALVIWQSWDAFINVWEKLPQTKVIKRRGEEEVSKEILLKLTKEFNNYRFYLIILSILLGILCMWVDSERERNTMYNEENFSGQLARACEDPDFLSKWLWNEWTADSTHREKKNPCSLKGLEGIKNPTKEQQYHWRKDEILKIINDNKTTYKDDRIHPPRAQWVTVLLFHLEDAVLISLGWLIFFQSLAHSYFFCRFEHLKISQTFNLYLELNVKSDLNEFGLERWNHALNNLYWYLSAALMIPILSRGSQRDLSNLDTSQLLLELFIPVIVATPMITTIIVRQMRIPSCWDRLSKPDYEKFLEQRLWPLDKNWSSKLGVLLAFLILSLFLGVNIATIF